MLTKQDGSGNNASSVTVCDATTPTNCAPVSATTGLKIDLSAAFGTAGSANTNVLSVQGIGSGTPLTVTGTGGTFPISGAISNASSAVATSSTNIPGVSYNYGFNGTTWDQLQVDGSKNLKVDLATAVPAGTNLMGKVGIDQTTPGTTNGVQANIVSGGVVSGAFASGSLAAGAGTDGWNVTEGTKADTAWSSGSGSLIAIAKTIAGNTGASVPAGSSIIGKVGIDQTTPGTTNGVQVNAALPAGTNLMGKVGIDQTTDGTTNGVRQTTQYPSGAVAETASATGTTAATTATLATNTGQTTYVCGFSIRANATAAATNNATVTGTITGTLNFTQWTAPLASGLGVTEMIFTPCIPASTTNTTIAVVSGAPGSGGVVSVSAWGFLK